MKGWAGNEPMSRRRGQVVKMVASMAFSLGALGNSSNQVLVLANEDDESSVEIAEYYLGKRRIPKENLILLPVSPKEEISWSVFLEEIYNPLRSVLVEDEWIEAIPSELLDSMGRRRYGVTGHRIDYLVICRGVPLKIKEDTERLEIESDSGFKPAFRTNRSSVDGELALMAHPSHGLTGWVMNPLFGQKHPDLYLRQQVIKVARLDGPTPTDVRRLIDSALLAENRGLMGRAYVDEGGRHPRGDEWLREVRLGILPLGYDLGTETSSRTFSQLDRFDAPALYFGWYADSITGPFLNPGFRFPPGAIAVHIHSSSAATLRQAGAHWCGPFVALGVAATVGNVYEPYLEFTHHLNGFFKALADGLSLGDAAYYSLPALSWQAVLIGDPLYQPFAVNLDIQLSEVGEDNSPVGQYAFIRKMRLLRSSGKFVEAIEWGKRGYRESPGLAIGLELGRAYLAAGNEKEAAFTLQFALFVSTFTSDDWIPAKEIADILAEIGETRVAVGIYRNLIESRGVPADLLNILLRDGAILAQEVGNAALARNWTSRIDRN